jgi:hypothetical protein
LRQSIESNYVKLIIKNGWHSLTTWVDIESKRIRKHMN